MSASVGVRFGLLFEHQLPRPWAEGAQARRLREAIEQAALADRVGFDGVWAAEHHFLEEASHAAAADVFLAACATATDRVRLGFAGLPLAPAYQHPARVAGAVATLDVLSGGRVELGTREGATGVELGGIGLRRELAGAAWEESLRAVVRMLVEEPFAGADGPHVRIPPRTVVPRGQQSPHPPLWAACTRREGIAAAARHGLGALCLAAAEPEEAASWVAEHRAIAGSERCRPIGVLANPRVALVLPMMVCEDEQVAIDRGIDGAHFRAYAQAHYGTFGEHRPGRTRLWESFERRREDVGLSRVPITAAGDPLTIRVLRDGHASLRGAIGSVEQVEELVGRYADAGVDELIFAVASGRVAHEHTCEAITLFAERILPRFRGDSRTAVGDGAVDGLSWPGGLAGDEAAGTGAGLEPDGFDASAGSSDAAHGTGGGGVPVPGTAGPPPQRLSREVEHVVAAFGDGVDVRPPAVPQAPGSGARSGLRASLAGGGLRASLSSGGRAALRTAVARADDRRLERTVGSAAGLRAVFAAMQRSFDPDRAAGFTGDIRYELRAADGSVRAWTVRVGARSATARSGARADPSLVVKLGLADFARVAAGELDPGRALLEGRLDLEGDIAVAVRLGEMFGG